jgi:tetratricopeptide (TPR) repeat protein
LFRIVSILVLVAAVLATYANSLRSAFVYDDYNDIVNNSSIRHLWPLWDVFLVRHKGSLGPHTRPVVNLSFALDYAAGGLNAVPYHVTNLAIHLLAALALFGIVRRTLLLPKFRDRFGRASVGLALAVALLWALHPLQTESVTYITQRYESMMGLFYLLAIYALIRCGDSTHPHRWAALTVAFTLLALGSKEVAVSLPIMILLFDRVLLSGSFSELLRRRGGMYLALLAVWIGFVLLQLRAGPRPWAGYALRVTWLEYARSQPGVILHYLRLAFWPRPLVFDYGWPPVQTVGEILPGAIVVGGLLAATGYALWKWPAWGLLGAWFFLILAPTSSVMPLADLEVEHRMYLPLAAVVALVVLGGYVLGRALLKFVGWDRAVAAVGACLLVAACVTLGYTAWQRNKVYQSEFALWQDTVDKRPDNCRAHCNLGLALADRRQTDAADAADAAIIEYEKALAIKPDLAEALCNLGSALAAKGQIDQAIVQYKKALKIRPDYAEAHNNLGAVYAGRGKIDAATTEYKEALAIRPDYAAAHNNLGNLLDNQGHFDEAIVHYRKALEIRPDDVKAHYNLGVALADHGKSDEAREQFQTALALATALNNKALAEVIQDRIQRIQGTATAGNHL